MNDKEDLKIESEAESESAQAAKETEESVSGLDEQNAQETLQAAETETPVKADENDDENEGGNDAAKSVGFAESLASASATDLGVKKRHRMRASHLIPTLARVLIMAILLGVFIYSGYTVVTRMAEYIEGEDLYDMLEKQFSPDSSEGESHGIAPLYQADDTVILPTFAEMLSGDFEYKEIVTGEEKKTQALYRTKILSLQKINSDIIGWLLIPGTQLSYPVVKTDNNSYYVEHDFYKRENSVGAIFADVRTLGVIEANNNVVIYGHNIRTRGLMFNHLLKYQDRDFFDNNKYVYLYTFNEVYKFKVFAFYETDTNDDYADINFASGNDFVSFCERSFTKSIYLCDRSEYDFTAASTVLTLSTCTNGGQDERFALQALLVEQTRYS